MEQYQEILETINYVHNSAEIHLYSPALTKSLQYSINSRTHINKSISTKLHETENKIILCQTTLPKHIVKQTEESTKLATQLQHNNSTKLYR